MMKIRPIILIIPVLLAAFSILSGSTLLWQLFIFYCAVLILGYIWLRVNLHNIELKLSETPETLTAGEWFDRTVTVSNRSIFPKFGVTVAQTADLHSDSDSVTITLPPESSWHWESKVFTRQRGSYDIGSFTVSASDPFHLIFIKRTVSMDRHILVYPAAIDLPLFKPELHFQTEDLYEQRMRNGTSSMISHVREYAYGDTLNHIHWKSTAHRGSLMVKVFEPEPARLQSENVWLLADMQRSDVVNIETIITVAASIFNKYITMNTRTGLIMEGDRQYIFNPGEGIEFQNRVRKALALVQPAGRKPAMSLLSEQSSLIVEGSTVILIGPAPDEQLVQQVRSLMQRNCLVITIFVETKDTARYSEALKIRNILSSTGAPVYMVKDTNSIAKALESHYAVAVSTR